MNHPILTKLAQHWRQKADDPQAEARQRRLELTLQRVDAAVARMAEPREAA
jgi:hypothetical protein